MSEAKYTGVYKDLKRRIEEGEYAPQTLLPTEFELSDRYGCTRNTIRRATSALGDIGYVQSIRGKGVVVIYQKLPQSMFTLGTIESMAEAADKNHKPYETKVIQFAELTVDSRLSNRIGFAEGTEVYYVQRARYFGGKAVILDHNYFLKSIVKDLTAEIAEHSVYQYMENVLGESIVSAQRCLTVEPVTQIDETYMDLDIEKYNCLAVVTSDTYNADGVMFEHTQSRHRPDGFAFYIPAKRDKLT